MNRHDYDRIARVIRFLDEHQAEQPSLIQLARHAGLSPSYFHRLFARWAGITPKDFLQCLTLEHARAALQAGRSVLDAAWDAGLSGPGRLHDLCVTFVAASPGEVKSGGAGWTIRADFAQSPFGPCLIGVSPRGVCHLSFVETTTWNREVTALAQEWPRAQIARDREVSHLVDSVFPPSPRDSCGETPLRVLVRGTEFQIRVWQALLRIPSGTLTSYGQIAELMGDRAAARAVGHAVGQNRLAYLIPCHRVIRETGVFGDYRWGSPRKKAIIAWEAASSLPSRVGAGANGRIASMSSAPVR